MQHYFETNFQGSPLRLALSALAIRCYTYDTNPAHINPDYLRFNDVVPADWTIVRPVVAEPGLSRVDYANGLSIAASDEHVSFFQTGLFDISADVVAPVVASRYLDVPPPEVTFDSVSINPTCALIYPGELQTIIEPHSRQEVNIVVQIDGVDPEITVRSLYRFPSKDIVITVSKGPSNTDDVKGLHIRGQMRYTVGDNEADAEFVRNVVLNWEQVLVEFYDIALDVCSRYLAQGG